MDQDLEGGYERALRPRPIKLLKLLYAQHVAFHKLSTMPRGESNFNTSVRWNEAKPT